MVIGKKMQDALNEQIKDELYSAYIYLSMSAWAEEHNLPGFAHWMRVQYQEETEHALKIYQYIVDRGGRVVLQAIDQPPAEFESPVDVFQQTLAHEQKVTALIHGLYALALKEADYPTQVFMHWFIDEQVEEEKNATEILELLKQVGAKGHALVMLDRQLASRGD